MASAGSTAPFSADALNRYRLAYNDRELRAVVRRINKLSHGNGTNESGQAPAPEAVAEDTELARLELEKWKLGVERMLASVGNLERQTASYLRKAEETVARTDALKQTLVEEKAQLAKGLVERDHRVKCDEVAKKIIARGKTRRELEEQIVALEASIVEHRTAYAEVLTVAESRSETFAKIVSLVDECRALKLPAQTSPEPMEVDIPSPVPAASSKLSATTLPFQPSTSAAPRAPASAPTSRGSTPVPTGPAGYAPPRPTRTTSAGGGGRFGRGGPTSLPPRPSNLRNVRGVPGLEDGEVGEEDGEVKEGTKRKAEETTGRATRRK